MYTTALLPPEQVTGGPPEQLIVYTCPVTGLYALTTIEPPLPPAPMYADRTEAAKSQEVTDDPTAERDS